MISFPHAVIDNALDPELLSRAVAEWPFADWRGWFRYENSLERKLACRDVSAIPSACRQVLFELNAVGDILSDLTRIPSLIPDLTLHGGGLHGLVSGGKLDVHLDCDRHPHFGVHRQLNLILYANPNWREEWGGNLELWDPLMRERVCSIAPVFNRLVIFETNDVSYHGVPDPVACPADQMRRSFAVYYWRDVDGDSKRPRARFVGRPTDSHDETSEQLRRERSML